MRHHAVILPGGLWTSSWGVLALACTYMSEAFCSILVWDVAVTIIADCMMPCTRTCITCLLPAHAHTQAALPWQALPLTMHAVTWDKLRQTADPSNKHNLFEAVRPPSMYQQTDSHVANPSLSLRVLR